MPIDSTALLVLTDEQSKDASKILAALLEKTGIEKERLLARFACEEDLLKALTWLDRGWADGVKFLEEFGEEGFTAFRLMWMGSIAKQYQFAIELDSPDHEPLSGFSIEEIGCARLRAIEASKIDKGAVTATV